MNGKKKLTGPESEQLLATLKQRFLKHPQRHNGITWEQVAERLEAHPARLWSLQQMELSGGEPDVIDRDPETGALHFYDCSPESPKERRSLCYDDAALAARKENKPRDSAQAQAEAMGIALLNEEQYRRLQQYGAFDLKTSSWIATPEPIRRLGGALFCDRRYDTVFTYHNGAESYYAARGFRGILTV